SHGKVIVADDFVALSVGMSQPRPSFRPAPSFRDVLGDAIHTDFFTFFFDPYYATYPEGGELLARYRRLNQSHHEYVLSADSRLKGYEEKVASLTGLELQVSTLKKQGKERNKKIKSLNKILDNLHAEVAHLSADLNHVTILEAKKDEEILRLKATLLEFSSFFQGQFQGLIWKFLAFDKFSRVQDELLSLAASAGFERGLSMHQTKDEFDALLKKMAHFVHVHRTMKPASESLELSANVVPAPSAIASDVVVFLCMVLTDVVVALFAGEKGDGSLPSSTDDDEATTNPFGV
nr:hypothetical protein [Tanacetum cinerariifolium]